jgi:glycosyltransferase involved in cell wall biosynthesis
MPKCAAMLFAPLPPPVGGIASITAMLHRDLSHRADVLFAQPVPKTASWKRALRPFVSIGRLVRGTLRVRRGGRVVFFCSSRASFWDKCVWAMIVLSLGRAVVMIMVAGDFPETFARSPRLARAVARWLFRRRGLTVGAQTASWAAVYRRIFPGATVTQVGATVDREFFQDRNGRNPASTRLTLLYVGWIIVDKGVADLLDALASIAPALRDRAQVRLVGPAFGREEFWQQEIARRQLASIVELVGPVTSRAAILREYHDADVFVFPSHYEGLPVALLEATAAGLPCVATDVGGALDLLDEGRAGLLVPPKAPAALASALHSLVTDAELRRRLGEAAAGHARHAYSPAACLASYHRVFGIA